MKTKMKIEDSDLMRRAVSHHLCVFHGISVKYCVRKKYAAFKNDVNVKTFGVPLGRLPQQYIPEYGYIPCFLVEACTYLLKHVRTVGLFRKPASAIRLNILRAKLNQGKACLSTALPCDVACLLKQFCRELPEPLFLADLHPALLKAQALPDLKDRSSATQMLSCLLPYRNASFLRHLFVFLAEVSKRCSENLMTSSNLAVVFAPCILRPCDAAEMANGRMQLKADVVRGFIETANAFGTVPDIITESVPFLLKAHLLEEHTQASRKRGTPGLKGFQSKRLSSTISVPWTPIRSKVRPQSSSSPVDFSSCKPRSLRRSLGLETFPNVLLFRKYSSFSAQPNRSTPASLSCGSVSRVLKKKPSSKVERSWNDPVLTAVEELNCKVMKRRSALF